MKDKKLLLGLVSVLVFTFVLTFSGMVSVAKAEGIISLNKASAEEITAIEDAEIPESLAKAIVEYREKNGPFKDPTDLRKVPGMTDDFYESLNPVLSDDGDVIYDPDAEPALAPSKC
ncbi:MAG TPA: helix-hairpin-helix domain-containing protein [Syntrophales bacterium]|nr:helix-hairpin-helix domain-containing protein [Syntrophales bacterium]HPQ44962.1 helix-hairpin-helix domain-containing protein [Syntrophales bacterium]